MFGLVAFFGLAVVTVDVLGGVLAATMLARGVRPVHLLAFCGGYAAVIIVATIILKPLLRFLGGFLAPVLGSEMWLAIIQIVVGVALIGFAIYQRHSALNPKPPVPQREVRDRWGSLAGGGALLALTTLADPAFTVAVGMAMQVDSLPTEILLLTGWNIVYQAPLTTVTVASLLGGHRRALDALGRFFGPRRRPLLLTFAAVLLVSGLVVIGDGIVSLASSHHSWLQSLLLLRDRT